MTCRYFQSLIASSVVQDNFLHKPINIAFCVIEIQRKRREAGAVDTSLVNCFWRRDNSTDLGRASINGGAHGFYVWQTIVLMHLIAATVAQGIRPAEVAMTATAATWFLHLADNRVDAFDCSDCCTRDTTRRSGDDSNSCTCKSYNFQKEARIKLFQKIFQIILHHWPFWFDHFV